MVAYLKKPEGSEGFHQIGNFLNVSHIRYALTENPTIYVSLIKQFWQTATARTLENGEIELTATIDGTVKTVTEASVRRHLQLADVDGIISLPTTEIFQQLSLMGAQLSRVKDQHTQQESVVPQSRSPTQTHVPDETVYEERGDSVERAATTATSLDAEQGSGNLSGELRDRLEADQANIWCCYITKLYQSEEVREQVKSTKLERARIRVGRQEHDMEFEFDLDAAKDVSTTKEDISTAKPVSTAGTAATTASIDVSTATVSTAKDKAALRLQAKLEEEERQRIANVQEAASSFNIEEWDDIQARVEVDEELAQRLQAVEREKYSEAEKARLLAELINQRKLDFQLRSYSFDEIKNLFVTTMRRVHTFVPMDSEIERAIPESNCWKFKEYAEDELITKIQRGQ
ncbi:hypothetical protein Tco_0344454 [Tanacetum coccineum]